MLDPFDPRQPVPPPRVIGHRPDLFGRIKPSPIEQLDQRRSPRAPMDLYINKVINGVPHLARAIDISAEGVRVHRLLEPVAPQRACIALEFMLPGTDEVIWAPVEPVMAPGDLRASGYRFVHLTRRHARLIKAYVEGALIHC